MSRAGMGKGVMLPRNKKFTTKTLRHEEEKPEARRQNELNEQKLFDREGFALGTAVAEEDDDHFTGLAIIFYASLFCLLILLIPPIYLGFRN
jgi:hypothetical protein